MIRTLESLQEVDFGMEDFDINEMFQSALSGVTTDEELALDEKVRRMEVIVSEGTSDVYREFVDFRQMVSQMEMMCAHDHMFDQSVRGSDVLGSLLDTFAEDDGHGHNSIHSHSHGEDDDAASTKKGKKKTKKKKKELGAFGVFHLL
jgi:hypothetical protein